MHDHATFGQFPGDSNLQRTGHSPELPTARSGSLCKVLDYGKLSIRDGKRLRTAGSGRAPAPNSRPVADHRQPVAEGPDRLGPIVRDPDLVGHAESSVTMEHSQKCRSKAGKCRNSHPIANLPNAAPALLAKRSGTELSAWPTGPPTSWAAGAGPQRCLAGGSSLRHRELPPESINAGGW